MGNTNCTDSSIKKHLNDVISDISDQLADSKTEVLERKKQLKRQRANLIAFRSLLEKKEAEIKNFVASLKDREERFDAKCRAEKTALEEERKVITEMRKELLERDKCLLEEKRTFELSKHGVFKSEEKKENLVSTGENFSDKAEKMEKICENAKNRPNEDNILLLFEESNIETKPVSAKNIKNEIDQNKTAKKQEPWDCEKKGPGILIDRRKSEILDLKFVYNRKQIEGDEKM